MSVRMDIKTVPCVDIEALRTAIEKNLHRPYTVIRQPVMASAGLKGFAAVVPAAVVGGSPSVAKYADALRKWGGPVWAINGAWAWCHDNGIDNATLFSVDPHPCLGEIVKGRTVKRGILGMACHASVFDEIEKQETKADVAIFDTGWRGLETGPTSATCALTMAPMMGYSAVNFFGCESSYTPDQQHHIYDGANEDEAWINISCRGGIYTTKAEWLLQAITLSQVIRAYPHHYRARGGGLLGALIEDPEWSIAAVSRAFRAGLEVPEGVEIETRDRP